MFLLLMGLCLRAGSRAAGCWTALVPNAPISSIFICQSSPRCRFVDIFSGFGIIVALLYASFPQGRSGGIAFFPDK